MILQDNDTTIEQIGTISDEAQFKMKASRKAFQILSDLYSDKPLAIVRELGCNASDSMTASGQSNRPFHIHLPNTLEPWLTIQDFGTGISHENIYNIYTTYFESTKTNTNTQIGCLGLGSKSPFCYTDNFTITSIVNGDKRIYNAYFNASNMPTISLMSMEKTTDENGIAIQIPIKSTDFSLFSHAVYKAFRFFDVRPTISGGTIDWEEIKPEFTGSFWKSYSKMNQSYAIMGGVTYPIDTYKIDNDHYDIIRKAGLVINFNIGEIDFTPSRESLSYCESTIKALNNKIDLVKKDFVAKVEETIKNSPNLLDAVKAIYMLNNQWSFLNSKLINTKVKWKSIDITDPRKAIKAFAPTLKNYSKKTWGRGKYSESEYPALNAHTIWMVNDTKRGAFKRVIQEIRNSLEKDININLVEPSCMNALIAAGFPATCFQKASDLPPVVAPARRTGTIRQGKPTGIITIYKHGNSYQKAWEGNDFDLATGTAPKFYIVKGETWENFDGGTLKDDKGNFKLMVRDKGSYTAVVGYLGLDHSDVVLIANKNVKALEALGSKSFKEKVDNEKVKIDFDKLAYANLFETNQVKNIAKHRLLSKLSDENPFKKFILEANEVIKESEKYSYLTPWIREKNSKKSLTFPNSMVELFYHSMKSWQVSDDMLLKAAIEIETKSN